MASSIYRHLIILFAFSSFTALAGAQEKSKLLSSTELLALVAGNALNENVVHEMESRGLAFRPSEAYRSQLNAAGADARVLAALGKAVVSDSSGAADTKESSELLQHLSTAGKLMRAKQYKEAAEELNGALQANGSVEAGFVMGELLKVQEQWPMAASVYQQVLKQAPDFPEVYTKLSYLMYRLGDSDDGLREAKVALTRTPENAEAHKNAGLSLDLARKFDAAADEYQEALRIKPDYMAAPQQGRFGRRYRGVQKSSCPRSKFCGRTLRLGRRLLR
jgi:tetratricopeptide (TPR) repeat protein